MDHEQTAFLAGGKWHVQYPLHGGTFSLAYAGRQFLSGAAISVATDRWLIHANDCGPGEAREEVVADILGSGRRLLVSHQAGEITMTVSMALYDSFPGLAMRMSVSNRGRKPLTVFGFNVIEALGEKAAFWPAYGGLNRRLFKSGYHTWAASTVRCPGDFDRPPRGKAGRVLFADPGSRPFDMKDHFSSDWMCAFGSRTGHEYCAMAFITCENQAGRFLYRRPDHAEDFLARSQTDGITLSEGDSIESETLYITIGGDPSALLGECAEAMGHAMNARVSGDPLWIGRIGSPNKPLENEAAGPSESCVGQPIPYDALILEGQWYSAVGDWDPISPLDAREWARKMRESGVRPGLWLAPFAVDAQSRLASEHPDWLIRLGGRPAGAGAPAGRPLFGIDLSRAGAEEWLRTLIRQVTAGWGFDCLMLDWLYAATLPGNFAGERHSRIANLRLGLRIIREEAPGALLMGGACPLGPAVGLLDSVRIGPESYVAVGPTFGDRIRGTAPGPRAFENAVNLAHLDRRLWRTAIMAAAGAPGDEGFEEAVTAGLGGSIVIVDKPGTIGTGGTAWKMQTFGGPALMAGLMDGGMKAILRADGTGGARMAVYRLNAPADSGISLNKLGMNGTFHVVDARTMEYLGEARESLKLSWAGRESVRALIMRPVLEHPHFVAGDLPGRVRVTEDYGNGVLRLRGFMAGEWQGRLIICVPDGRKPTIGTCLPEDGRLFSIPVQFDGTFEVEVAMK